MTFDREKIELIKRTVAKGATDAELELFLYRAKVLGLDPLSGQIHFQKRKSWNSETKQYDETVSIQIGIDGFRLIADRSGKYSGQEPVVFMVQRNNQIIETEYAMPDDQPIAAKATVYKEGVDRPFIAIAHYTDYVQKTKEGKITSMWQKWTIMLPKCAEAAAFRKGFPEQLSGVYEPAEIPVETETGAPQGYDAQQTPAAPALPSAPALPEPQTTFPTGKSVSEAQLRAIRQGALKLGVAPEAIEARLSGIGFDEAKELIKAVNRGDLTPFDGEPVIQESAPVEAEEHFAAEAGGNGQSSLIQ